MKTKDQIALFTEVTRLIFLSKQMGTDITQTIIATNTGRFPGRWFSGNSLRGFDITINPGKKVIPIRIIEQNPHKTDKYLNYSTNAVLAQKGHQITWVIRTDTNEFIGKVMDGKFEHIKPRVITTTSFTGGGYKQTPMVSQDQFNQDYHNDGGDDWVADLPEINIGEAAYYITGI